MTQHYQPYLYAKFGVSFSLYEQQPFDWHRLEEFPSSFFDFTASDTIKTQQVPYPILSTHKSMKSIRHHSRMFHKPSQKHKLFRLRAVTAQTPAAAKTRAAHTCSAAVVESTWLSRHVSTGRRILENYLTITGGFLRLAASIFVFHSLCDIASAGATCTGSFLCVEGSARAPEYSGEQKGEQENDGELHSEKFEESYSERRTRFEVRKSEKNLMECEVVLNVCVRLLM